MLSQMRKHAGSWMIKVLLFAIVVVFSLWGVGSFRERREKTYIADVNGEKISYEAYRKSYNTMIEQYRRMYSGNLTEEMLKILNPGGTALDNLIFRVLTLQEAKRLGIQVTDEELDTAIRSNPAFQVNGMFDEQRAKRILSMNNYSTSEFRVGYQEDLLINKVRALIVEGVVVTEDEARQWYEWMNAEINLNHVLFEPARYEDVAPTDEEIKSYFESHSEDYKTEPKVKVRYLFFNPDDYKSQAQASEDKISLYYSEHPAEFKTEKTVEARHILLKLDADADEKTVAAKKAKADEIYEMAKQGNDFAELAKQFSEGPTRDKGGYLGEFKKKTMVQPFADKAFSMEAGQISEPVRTEFGWHIIKVEKVNEAATQAYEEVKEKIRAKLIAEEARKLALDKADSVFNNLFDGDDLSVTAETHKVPVETTDFFTRNNPPKKGIRNTSKFAEAAFGLEKMAISEIQDLGNGYYLLQMVDRQEAAIPSFESVADKVRSDVVKSQQKDRAKADAEEMLAGIAKGQAWSDLVSKYKLKETATDYFKRSGSIPQIGYEPEIVKAAFNLSMANPVSPKAIEGRQGYYVIRLKDRKTPSIEGFEKEKGDIIPRLTSQKKQSTLQQWVEDMKTRSKIDKNQKMIQ